MTRPEILRHNGPHTVELSEGSKDASRRQGSERQEMPEDLPLPHPATGLQTAPHLQALTANAQLHPADAESIDDWLGQESFSERLEQLRARNRQLNQSLRSFSRTASREDPHE